MSFISPKNEFFPSDLLVPRPVKMPVHKKHFRRKIETRYSLEEVLQLHDIVFIDTCVLCQFKPIYKSNKVLNVHSAEGEQILEFYKKHVDLLMRLSTSGNLKAGPPVITEYSSYLEMVVRKLKSTNSPIIQNESTRKMLLDIFSGGKEIVTNLTGVPSGNDLVFQSFFLRYIHSPQCIRKYWLNREGKKVEKIVSLADLNLYVRALFELEQSNNCAIITGDQDFLQQGAIIIPSSKNQRRKLGLPLQKIVVPAPTIYYPTEKFYHTPLSFCRFDFEPEHTH